MRHQARLTPTKVGATVDVIRMTRLGARVADQKAAVRRARPKIIAATMLS